MQSLLVGALICENYVIIHVILYRFIYDERLQCIYSSHSLPSLLCNHYFFVSQILDIRLFFVLMLQAF